MKFKYYLRGLGVGIIFTTLVMSISCVIHNNNLSDEEIIEKAIELGMVMPESQSESESGASGGDDSSESDGDSESEDDSETEYETQIESERESETESESETNQTVHIETVQYILHINSGDSSWAIAKELYKNGMIDSQTAFSKYMSENGYAKRLKAGTYTITKGMTYEEIAEMITR